jgi:DnaJ family protein B protein 12
MLLGVAELMTQSEILHKKGHTSTPKPAPQPPPPPPAPRAAPASARPSSASPSSGAGENSRPYTAEQETIAARVVVLSKKCYYQTLSITKRADDSEIKKAYRKLALKLHPDKNSAPSSEAAFKAISDAMDTLSDSNKRHVYDQMGHDGASQHMSQGGGGGGGGGFGRNPNDLNPEDIMNMFFGGGMGGGMGGGGFRTYNFGGRQNRRATRPPQRERERGGDDGAAPGGFGQIFQLIPMLLLLLSMTGFFSSSDSGGAWSKPHSLYKQHPYNIQRATTSYGVTHDIPYFVTETFRGSYGTTKADLRRAEAQVEVDFKQDLYSRCDREKKHKARQIYEVKYWINLFSNRTSIYVIYKIILYISLPGTFCDVITDVSDVLLYIF